MLVIRRYQQLERCVICHVGSIYLKVFVRVSKCTILGKKNKKIAPFYVIVGDLVVQLLTAQFYMTKLYGSERHYHLNIRVSESMEFNYRGIECRHIFFRG